MKRKIKFSIRVTATVVLCCFLLGCKPLVLFAAWDVTRAWDTGDINTRSTDAAAIIDKDHNGTPYIIAPVRGGVKCYSPTGTLQWTNDDLYSHGIDIRDLAVGDLNGTGYEDSLVVASGYYPAASDGKFMIVDKDGNTVQLFKGTDFTSSPSRVDAVVVDGTDIYVGTNLGITKFVKSGGTWSEDSTNWAKAIGEVSQIKVDDMGNGKRVYLVDSGNSSVYSFETNGTQEWKTTMSHGYLASFGIGKTDSSKAGLQMVVPYQTGLSVLDKDGNISWSGGPGYNVFGNPALYDNDGDGQDEIYYSDMGQDVYVLKHTGPNTYTQQYSLLNAIGSGAYAGLSHYNLNGAGDDEILIYTTDGHLLIYNKTLSTELKDLNIGHGEEGGNFVAYHILGNGIFFVDTSGDGHADIVISGSDGYVDVYETSGFAAPPVANFTASPTFGSAPLSVQFTDTSTGSPTSWSWDFGDGATSSAESPSHIYGISGTYSVNLVATSGGGSDTETKTGFITVSPLGGGEMSSANYTIVNSKLSIGGVELANSPNYQLSNTIGQIAPGKSASQNYNLHAGYRHMATTTSISISISNEPDVTLSPQVSGISGGTGNATTSWTVTTSNSAGYTLSVKASTDPALQTGSGSTSASFSDYTETTAGTPDYTWSITNTTSAFGFSVEGSDTASTFLDNGTTCNTGTGNTPDSCWSGFSTTAQTIAEGSSATPNQGTVTTLNLRAEVGGNKIQQNGDYTATLTATALAT